MALTELKTTDNFTYTDVCEFIEHKENKLNFQNKVKQFEKALAEYSTEINQDKDLPAYQGYEEGYVKHSFADGQYIRAITMPEGMVIATKIHNQNHPFFVMKGKCSVYSEKGTEIIEAPYHGITDSGTKRLLYIPEECVWVTVHCTDKLTLAEVEEECIAKDFEKEFLPVDTKQIDKLIDQIRSI